MATSVYVGFGLVAGAMLPFQAGINAQLAAFVGSPIRAALISFAIGTIALLLLTLAVARGWSPNAGPAPWWAWIGGILGGFYVAGSIVTAPKLGAVTLVAVLLAGQTAASLAVDHFGWVGFEEQPITTGRVAGIALVALGVTLVRLF